MASGRGARDWWQYPAARAVGFVALGLAVFAAILLFGQHNTTDRRFTHTLGFRGWAAMATLSVGVSVAAFSQGLSNIRGLAATWKRPRAWWIWNLAAYAVLGAAASVLLRLIVAGSNPASSTIHVPIQGFAGLIGVLTLAGVIAAAPWVLMVWLAHEELHNLSSAISNIRPAEPAEPTKDVETSQMDGPAVTAALTSTLAIWTVIERCALALALIVSTAVFNTGALRLGLINTSVIKASGFPASSVLGYGVVYAVVVAILIIPLVLGWRSQAVNLVEHALGSPAAGVPSSAWMEARERLERRLRLDTPFFRRPITALSLLSPLATAFLTTLVPNAS
jgi:hypothetical protein